MEGTLAGAYPGWRIPWPAHTLVGAYLGWRRPGLPPTLAGAFPRRRRPWPAHTLASAYPGWSTPECIPRWYCRKAFCVFFASAYLGAYPVCDEEVSFGEVELPTLTIRVRTWSAHTLGAYLLQKLIFAYIYIYIRRIPSAHTPSP